MDNKTRKVYPYRTYETDVVIIGGGVAGLFAARNVFQNGQTAILVDKGPFGHSGSSGINWGHNMSDSYEKFEMTDEFIHNVVTGYNMNHDGMAPQQYIASLVKSSKEARPFEFAQKTGGVLERKASDGMPNGEPVPDSWLHSLYPRIVAQYLARKGLVIQDWTMVLDILQAEDGSVSGILALDQIHGEIVLIRCKAVVHAMGNACHNFGWQSNGTKSTAGKECTADGFAILMRKGVPYAGMEFQWPYWRQMKPEGIAYTQGVGIGGNEHPYDLSNKDGEHIYKTSQLYADWPTLGSYWKTAWKHIYNGKSLEGFSEDDDYCLDLDITNIEEPQNYMKFSRRVSENIHRGLGYTYGKHIPMGLEFWDTQELPKMDYETFAVEGLPGCFIAKSSWGAFLGSSAGGHRAGGSAAKFAKNTDRKPVDFDEVQKIIGETFDALYRQPEDGIRVNTVVHKIQKLVHNKILLNREEKNLLDAIKELERIKEEDFPRMYVPDKSTRFNYEWRQAIEIQNMWLYSRAFAESCLIRKETRGTHPRLDFQDMDNTNFFKFIFIKLNEDGSFEHSIEEPDFSIVPKEEMLESVQEVGMGDYPQKGNQRITHEAHGHG